MSGTSQAHTELGIAERYHFWIRRLHSLAGVLPLGVFIVFHLTANASILGGESVFDNNIHLLHETLGPMLIPVELALIFFPLAFHIGYGLVIARQARMNAGAYPYASNKRFSLQRISAYVATAFILYHLWHMHWLGKPLGGAHFNPELPTESAAQAMQAHWLISLLYVVGVICTVYHFANGLWTALITWGVTIGERSQRGAGWVCGVLGFVLGLAGLGAVVGFSRQPTGIAPQVDTPTNSHAMHVDDRDTAPEDG